MGVADTAAMLAVKWVYDMDKTYITGLLHDCGKVMSEEDKIKNCDKHNLEECFME